jgi:hypothetical protein
MPKQMIDATELLAKLQAERAELDAAIKALTRHAFQNAGTLSPTPRRSHHKQPDAPAGKRGRRLPMTQGEKDALSRKLKLVGARRKKQQQ